MDNHTNLEYMIDNTIMSCALDEKTNLKYSLCVFVWLRKQKITEQL